jgi:hypothetical protein
MPFYPANGFDVFVPCVNSYRDEILVWNYSSGRLGPAIETPFWPVSMTYDTRSGLIYAGGWNASGSMKLGAINPDTGVLTNVLTVVDASFAGFFSEGGYLLAYDPATDRLLLPNVSGPYGGAGPALVAVDPSTGLVDGQVALGAPVLSLVVDTSTNQILAATDRPYQVDVFNAQTYSSQGAVSLPTCLSEGCAGGDARQILIDPSHGDAYLLTSLALDALNLSTLTLVGSIFDYGDGGQGSGAYVPNLDRVFGAFWFISQQIPGFMDQLSHTVRDVLTSFLWVPTSGGILAAAAIVGTAFALVRFRGPPVSPRVRRPRSNPADSLDYVDRFWPGRD